MPPCRARSIGRSIAAACLALACAFAGSGPAGAVDWHILYRLNETLRVSDNIELRPDPEGAALSSHTGAGLDIAARTPTSEWITTGDIGQILYFGEGAPEDDERTTVAATSTFLKTTRSTDFNLAAHFSMAPATGTALADPLSPPELDDLGLELVDFDRISFGGAGGFLHHWTRRDDLTVNASADWVDFTGDAANATPYRLVELSGVWTRRMTRLVDGRVLASVGHFQSEGEDDLRRLIYNFTGGANVRPTRRLTLDLNGGAAIIDEQSDPEIGEVSDRSDLSVGFIGDLSFTYTPRRDTVMTLALSQRVSPNSLGDLRSTRAVSGAVVHQINERSRFDLRAAFTDSTAAGGDGSSRQAWTVSPSYTHALTRSWDLTLGYRWLKSDVAESNTAFLTLSHRGTILP